MHLQLCGMINGKPFIIADLSTARNLSSYPIFTYIKCYSSLLILIVDTFLFTLICSLWRALPLYTVSHVCRQYLFYVLCAHLVIYFILFPFYPFFLCSAVVSNVKSLSLVNYPNVFRWYANNEHWKKTHVFDIWCCFMSFHCRFGYFVVITSLEIDHRGNNQLSFGKIRGNKSLRIKKKAERKKKLLVKPNKS